MQSRWKRWEAIHTSLGTGSAKSIMPEELKSLFDETFTIQICRGSSLSLCHQSPRACLHCHQLLALSAVTVLASVMEMKTNECSAATLTGMLMHPDRLSFMVSLLQHPCQCMRYQARRALATLLSVHTPSALDAVPAVLAQCVKSILQVSNISLQPLEPLQLLCSLSSRRTGSAINLQCLEVLKAHLSDMHTLFKGMCFNPSVHAATGTVNSTGGCMHKGVKTSESGSGDHMMQSASSDTDGSSSSNTCSDSLYLFLCLVQKLSKCINCLEEPQRLLELQFFHRSVLKQVTDDLITMLQNCGKHSDLLVVRKTLDVVDTILNYDRSLGDTGNVVLISLAHQILCGLGSTDSFWQHLSPQQIFIGGTLCEGHAEVNPLVHASTSTVYSTTGCIHKGVNAKRLAMPSDDSCCNPTLVLLLAVTLKSCTICLRAAAVRDDSKKESEFVWTTVILAMHSSLKEQLHPSQISSASETGGPKEWLNWLPQVCGDQDDRWMEALLNLLDIYLHVRTLQNKQEDEDTQKLLTLVEPHTIFIQLASLTYFDSSLFIDWLTAPETCCLQYLTRYLRLLTSDFTTFVKAAQSWLQCPGSSLCSLEPVHLRSSVQAKHSLETYGNKFDVQVKLVAQDPLSGVSEVQTPQWGDDSTMSCLNPLVHAVTSTVNSSGDCMLQGIKEETEFVRMEISSYVDRTSGCIHKSATKDFVASSGLALLSGYGDADEEYSDTDSEDNIVQKENGKYGESMEAVSLDHGNMDACVSDDDSTDDSGDDDVGADSDVDDCAERIDDTDINSGDIDYDDDDHHHHHHHHHYDGNAEHLQRNMEIPSQQLDYKSVRQHDAWEVNAGSGMNCLDRVVCLLLEIRQKLERLHSGGLMAYNPRPLVALLYRCEQLYEQHMRAGL